MMKISNAFCDSILVCTTLRPDIVMWSTSTKQLVMIELAVPWEERIEDAYERKKANYQELVEESKAKGWKVWCFPVEGGFPRTITMAGARSTRSYWEEEKTDGPRDRKGSRGSLSLDLEEARRAMIADQ